MNQYYTFIRDGKPEKVVREVWRWRVIYRDGSELRQFDDDTQLFHQFSEVDHSRVMRFIMEHATEPAKILDYAKETRPIKFIHFYKNFLINVATPAEVRVRLYCFGTEIENEKQCFVITPDNKLHEVSDFNSVQAI